jgi:hypothetical protein
MGRPDPRTANPYGDTVRSERCGRGASPPAGRRVLHAERIEDVRLRIAIEPLAADAPHDVAEQKN